MAIVKPDYVMVGCGHIAQKHLPEIYRTGNLIAVCDPHVDHMNALRLSDGVTRYTSVGEIIEGKLKADVFVICSPNAYHAEQSIAALRMGAHVLCEKPMAIKASDAKSMIEAADAYDRGLTIVKQIRYYPPIKALKKWISTGKSGKVFSVLLNGVWNRNNDYYSDSVWRGKKELDGGILYTQFSHFIDILIWLLGDAKAIKSAFQNVHHRASSEFEDQGSVLLEFENDILGTLHFSINSFEKNLETSLLIIAENGNIKIGGQYCDTLEYAHTRKNDFVVDSQPYTVKHSAVYDHFLNGITNKEYDRKSLTEAYKSIQLIEQIYKVQ